MASSGGSASTGPTRERLPPLTPPVSDDARRLLTRLSQGEKSCADAMAALCHDRAAEVAAMPVPLAAALVRGAVEAAARSLCTGDASMGADALSTLRHLLACPSLCDVAIKASRLKSLAICAIQAAMRCDETRADAASAALLQVLHEAGVGITAPGLLEESTTPLIMALHRYSFVGAAQVLLDAGADVNGLSRDGETWPLLATAVGHRNIGTAWLLEHGASLTVTNLRRRTLAHLLGAVRAVDTDEIPASTAKFFSEFMGFIIAEEPSLLEARDDECCTPLVTAATGGSETCVAALLACGADVAAADPDGWTALCSACAVGSLPVVRLLVAAGAASVAPGSPQARRVALAAATGAFKSGRGCGDCRGRCRGSRGGNCADGLEILRTVLAAGVREAVAHDWQSMGSRVAMWLRAADSTKRISAEHALAILQALHAGGVDVLARGPADGQHILHAAAAANAAAVVRWLVVVPGAALEQREDSEGHTPLFAACNNNAWAAAHALLDCGARVDVQCIDWAGWWPVSRAAAAPDPECSVLRRILAADPESLLRRSPTGASALHVAASNTTAAMKVLLGSGLPHLAEAVDALAVLRRSRDDPDTRTVTPLHCACDHNNWAAALALLAAGARVDVAGCIDGKLQTIAEWARRSPTCKHRGVKLAVAARAQRHAAQTGAVATSGPAGGAGAGAGKASAAAGSGAVGGGGRAHIASGARSEAAVDGDTATPGFAAAAAADSAAGRGKLTKSRRARRGAASNRAEELPLAGEPAQLTLPGAAAIAADSSSRWFAFNSGVKVSTSAATAAAAPAAPFRTRDDPATASAAAGAGTPGLNSPAVPASAALSLDLPEDPLSRPSLAAGAALRPPEQTGVSADSAGRPSSELALRESVVSASAVEDCAASTDTWEPDAEAGAGANTCEPGAEAGAGANTCEPGAEAGASTNTCEPGAEAEAGANTCEPGAEAEAGANTCEPGAEAGAEAEVGANTCEPGAETGC